MTGPELARRRRVWRAAGVVLLVVVAGYAVWGIRALQEANTARDRAIGALSVQVEAYRSQAAEHGLPTGPPPVSIVQGATGPAGPGPTDAQVAAAVAAYLILHPPAANVAPADVTAAVAAYLAQHPPAPGPPPSDAQVSSAVAAYMAAHPAPSGPAGPTGPAGVQGDPGPAGPAGAPGSAPAGWTWTDPSGTTYDCAQDSQQPAPHYTCTARQSPSPSPSHSPSSAPTPSASPTPPLPTVTPAAKRTAAVRQQTAAPVRRAHLDMAPAADVTASPPAAPAAPSSPSGPGPLAPLSLSDPVARVRRIVPGPGQPVWPVAA